MRVVLIDTASPTIGVAAWDRGTCRGAWTAELGAGAEGWLAPAIADALATLDGLDAVAIVTGPGTFTGLRVGLAHGLGLALARSVGVIPVPTLALRAAAAPGRACVLALLDARKGRLYAQGFDTRGPLPTALAEPADVPPASLGDLLGETGSPPEARAVGEGATVAAGALAALGAIRVDVPVDGYLRAAGALLAAIPPQDPATVIPRYVREPDAQPPRGLPVMIP